MQENGGRNSTETDQRGQPEGSFPCGCLALQVGKVQEFFIWNNIKRWKQTCLCLFVLRCSAADISQTSSQCCRGTDVYLALSGWIEQTWQRREGPFVCFEGLACSIRRRPATCLDLEGAPEVWRWYQTNPLEVRSTCALLELKAEIPRGLKPN